MNAYGTLISVEAEASRGQFPLPQNKTLIQALDQNLWDTCGLVMLAPHVA